MDSLSLAARLLLVCGLMTTQTIGWGTTFSQVGILATPIVEDLGLSRGTVFLGASILYFFAAVTAPRAGRVADSWGGLMLLIPGSLILTLGLWLISRADSAAAYLFPWALIGCVYHVGLVTATYTALAQVLGRDATWAISTVTIATGLCSAIFWPVSEALLALTDWRGVLKIYAAITLLGCLPIHVLLWLRFGHLRAGQGDNTPSPALPHVRTGHEDAAQRLMIAIACVGSLMGVGFGVAAIEVFTALGAPRSDAIFAGSLMGLAYVVSRGIVMVLGDRLPPPLMAQFTYAVLPLSLCPLLYYAFSGDNLPGWVAIGVAFTFGLPAGLVGLLRSLFPLYPVWL